jgi:hypothetical protein
METCRSAPSASGREFLLIAISGSGPAGSILVCTPANIAMASPRPFAEARSGFEADWNQLLLELLESAFDEYRHDRETRADIRAKRDRGEKLDSEIPTSMMQCACEIRFDSHVWQRIWFTCRTFTRRRLKVGNREIR